MGEYMSTPCMDVTDPDEAARWRIRGIVESYISDHGDEDNLNRAAGSLRSHGVEKVQSTIDRYRNTWRADPDIDTARLADLEEALHE